MRLLPGVVDIADVVVLDVVVSSLTVVVGVVTVVTFVVTSVVVYSRREWQLAPLAFELATLRVRD